MAASNPIALRLASHVALIHLTGFLAKKALGLTWDYKGAIKEVWKKIVSEVREGADIANAALKHVVSLAASKQDHFWTTTSGDEKQPLNGWLGAWEEGADLAIFPHVLDDILKKQGYEPAAIIREWRDKRWLNTKGEKKALTKKVTVGKVRSRCYVIRQEVVKKFGGGTSEVSELFDDCKF
jgi:hypothetical protein